ncbi:MAG: hypothetical protein K2H15_00470 [Muribaculaceae bacterium]|nr:hypothetical protein [Muribaculaceae bacterium]
MFEREELEKFTLFNPAVDKESKIADCPGRYVILLCKGSSLPTAGIDYTPCTVSYKGEEYELIYVGISNKSLRKRDYHQHFKGNNAGQSTLRKSLGSLMGMKKTYRSEGERGKSSPKIKFIDDDEEKLSEWMQENLLLLFKSDGNPGEKEKNMIALLNPPLNIQYNSNIINSQFRSNLTRLRNDRSDLD